MKKNPFIKLPNKEITPHPLDNKVQRLHAHRAKTYHNSVYNVQYPPKNVKKQSLCRTTFTVIGNRVTKEFLECCEWVTVLHKYRSHSFAPPVIRGLSQLEWLEALKGLKLKYGANVFCIRNKVAVLINNTFLGNDEDLKKLVMSKYSYRISLNYQKRGEEEFMKFVKNSGRAFTYMHIMINDEITGSFIFMLYTDVVPLTCDNFLRLCRARRGGYGGTPVHRIVKDGWIQCGGYGLKHVHMPCENYAVPHDRRGVLSMANNGRHCANSTQFFITLQPTPWMNQKYVAFGQLIDGDETLKKLESIPTRYEAPAAKIIICRARELELEPKRLEPCPNHQKYLDQHLFELNEFIGHQVNSIMELWGVKLDDKEYLKRLLQEYLAFVVPEEEQEEEIEEETTERSSHTTENIQQDSLASGEPTPRAESSVFETKAQPPPPKILIMPFGDIKYLGECDSDCDLESIKKKCQLVDIEILKRVPPTPTTSKISARGSMLAEIKSLQDDDDLNSEDYNEIHEYLRMNADRVSFAGSIIRNIARSMAQTNLLHQSREMGVDKVPKLASSIHAMGSGGRFPVRTRKATFLPVQFGSKDSPVTSPAETSFLNCRQHNTSDPSTRKVRIASMISRRVMSQHQRNERSSHLMTRSSIFESRRQSALTRLLRSNHASSIDSLPTLRDYRKRMTNLTSHKNFFLTTSALRRSELAVQHHQENIITERSWTSKEPADTMDKILSLRHGQKLKRRYSSDYVYSRYMFERALQKKMSIREVEFSKIRPAIPVDMYKRLTKEKEDREVVENQDEPITDVCKRACQHLRRHYSWMAISDEAEDTEEHSHLTEMALEEDYFEMSALEEYLDTDESSQVTEALQKADASNMTILNEEAHEEESREEAQ